MNRNNCRAYSYVGSIFYGKEIYILDLNLILKNINCPLLCGIIFVLTGLIEVSKIEINPWSIVLGWLGTKINKPLKDELSEIKSEIKTIKESQNEMKEDNEFTKAMTSRYRIIRAADEIRNGGNISDEHLEQLGEDVEIYDGYCNSHPEYSNHKGQKSKELVLLYENQRINSGYC